LTLFLTILPKRFFSMDLGEVLQVIDDYADCLPSRPIKLAGSRIVVVVTAAMPETGGYAIAGAGYS
jgi:hypothetical protein